MRSSPLIGADGTIYVGSLNHTAYALRPGANPSSRVLWSRDLGSSVEASPAIGSDGTIYFPATEHSLFAFGP